MERERASLYFSDRRKSKQWTRCEGFCASTARSSAETRSCSTRRSSRPSGPGRARGCRAGTFLARWRRWGSEFGIDGRKCRAGKFYFGVDLLPVRSSEPARPPALQQKQQPPQSVRSSEPARPPQPQEQPVRFSEHGLPSQPQELSVRSSEPAQPPQPQEQPVLSFEPALPSQPQEQPVLSFEPALPPQPQEQSVRFSEAGLPSQPQEQPVRSSEPALPPAQQPVRSSEPDLAPVQQPPHPRSIVRACPTSATARPPKAHRSLLRVVAGLYQACRPTL